MYCKYGFCSNYEKKSCFKIHNTNLILNIEIIKSNVQIAKNKKNKKIKINEEEKVEATEQVESLDEKFDMNSANNAHTSGIDAFMTGYAFVYFLQKHSNLNEIIKMSNKEQTFVTLSDLNVNNWLNNVYLTGKDYPLIINKSNFATTSLNHKEKMNKINNN